MTQNDIKYLEQEITRHAQLYYEGNPEISDVQFDALTDELQKVSPDSEVLRTVGWGYNINKVSGTKVEHKYQIVGSLGKAKSYDALPSDIRSLSDVIISGKLDGISCVAYFINGMLGRGVTRGNGKVGLDKTDKLSYILGKNFRCGKFTGAIRGELVISNENWAKICADKTQEWIDSHSQRNYAAGIINRGYIDQELDYIDFVVYNVLGDEHGAPDRNRRVYGAVSFYDQYGALQFLKTYFKNVVPFSLATLNADTNLRAFYDRFCNEKPYLYDGLVITDPKIVRDGPTVLYHQIAYKFEADSEETVVTGVTWNLTRTGRYVPTVNFETVALSGANISNATGNNARFILENGIGKDARVVVTRSNEVIPQIIKVISEAPDNVEIIPIVCPECSKALSWNGADLVCTNPECSNKEYRDLQNWMIVLGSVDGLGWTLMEKFLSEVGVESIYDLYKKDFKFDANGSKQRGLFIESLNKLLSGRISPVDALCALNIKRLGRASAEKIIANKELWKRLKTAVMTDISLHNPAIMEELVSTVGAATAESITNSEKFINLGFIIDRIDDPVEEVSSTGELIKVCVTGKLSVPRKNFEVYLKEHGYVNAAINKDTKYLITDDPHSGSSKNKAADKLGIKKITEAEFRAMIG